tara:strand:+ start:5982 stop:6137 length:156 start_codon:yes stop_codon:yes gene_type:complete
MNKRFFVEFENHSYIYVYAKSAEEVRQIIETTEDTETLHGTSPILSVEATE